MPRLLITIPTWNEAATLEQTLATVTEFARVSLSLHDVIVEVADNGSTDETRKIAQEFSSREPMVSVLVLSERGKGIAIRRSWEWHVADRDILIFTDADLAADLSVLPTLVERIEQGSADLVCGSRFVAGAKVERSLRRELVSRAYRLVQRAWLHLPVQDAQCGLKAMSAKGASMVLPLCQETGWMLDSELIAICAKKQLNIAEIPVSWVEQRDPGRRSAVHLLRDGYGFLLGLARIRRRVVSLD